MAQRPMGPAPTTSTRHSLGDLGAVDPVEGDGQRLDQTGVLEAERFGQAPRARRVDPGGIGHPAVPADAVHGLDGGRALLHCSGPAALAPTAVLDGDDGDPSAVVESTGELMAERRR